MGFAGKCASIVVVILAVYLFYKIKTLAEPPETPQVDDIWWGPGNPAKVDSSIRPFKIDVSDAVSYLTIIIIMPVRLLVFLFAFAVEQSFKLFLVFVLLPPG